MYLSHSKKFVFVHIGKNGGDYITAILTKQRQPGDIIYCIEDINIPEEELNDWRKNVSPVEEYKHATAQTIKEKFFDEKGIDDKNYFWFAFLRNPHDRLVSWYSFFTQNEWSKLKHPDLVQQALEEGFVSFIKRYPLPTQASMIEDNNGKSLVNFLGSVENMDADMEYIAKKININYTPKQKINKSTHKHYTEYYDQESYDYVKDYYSKDFKYWENNLNFEI